MDLDDLNIFDKLSTGTFALLSGILIIATVTIFIYTIYPLLSGYELGFIYAMVGLVLGIIAPLFFFIEDLFDISDIIGKFVAGISIAILVVILINIYATFDLGSWLKPFPQVLLSGIMGFVTSLFLVRGVIVPAYGEYYEPESKGWSYEEKEKKKSSAKKGLYESSEPERFPEDEEFTGEEDKFPEEEEDPW